MVGRDSEAPPLGLAGVPSRDDRALTPAEVRNRLRELQALCDAENEALLFVSGPFLAPSSVLDRSHPPTGLPAPLPA